MISLQSAVCSTSDMRLFQHVVHLPLEARPGHEEKRQPSRPSTEMHPRADPDIWIVSTFAAKASRRALLLLCLLPSFVLCASAAAANGQSQHRKVTERRAIRFGRTYHRTVASRGWRMIQVTWKGAKRCRS